MTAGRSSRRLASASTFLGSIGNIAVVAAQSILLTPLYLQRIGDHRYGAWLGSGDVLVWMQAFDLGLPNLLIQRIGAAHARGDEREVGRWLATGMIALGIVAVIIGVAGSIIAAQLPGWFDLTGADADDLRRAFAFGSIAIAATVLNNGVVGYSRGVQRTGFITTIMILGTIVAFCTSLVLVLNGVKLMAIAWGLAARAAVLIAGSIVFLSRDVTGGVRAALSVDRQMLREFGTVLPATAIGGLSYAAMNQSELALMALLISPQAAAVYMVTRRAAELVRAVADTVSFSVYGSFAHLVGSPERARASTVYAGILALRTSIAVALSAAFIAANPSFVAAWVGPDRFAGLVVSALLGLQSIIVGGAYLTNFLYRATGGVVRGSVALAIEAAVRVMMSIALIRLAGPAGLPIAATATALLFGYLAHRWTVNAMKPFAGAPPSSTLATWTVRVALLGAAVWVSTIEVPVGWLYPIAISAVFATTGAALLFWIDPHARTAMRGAGSALAGLRARASA